MSPGLPSMMGGKLNILHVIVVSLSLALTVIAWQYAKHQVEKRIALRFDAASDSAVALIKDRMSRYEDALWAGVSMIHSHDGNVDYLQWRDFAQTMHLSTKYPGVNGIGIIQLQTDETLDEYVARQRAGRPGFRVYPPHDQNIYMPITYIEPEVVNAEAVGLDVAHERNRRTAALASRDSGTAQITGPIVLVQDAGNTPGFLFYAPFYEAETPPDIDTRQEQFRGAVYAPFVVRSLMEGLLAKDLRSVRFSIRDKTDVLYDEHAQVDANTDPNPMFSKEVGIDLYGRTWTLDIRTDLQFRASNTYAQPYFILIAGLIVEALIITLLVFMARANNRAVSYADMVTKALRTEKLKLADSNQALTRQNEDLEQFAYIASHDLKTPIRGIGGLTEMIEEDLQDYFAQDTANPEVVENLAHIRSRLKHMENLTCGILVLSQTALKTTADDPVELDTLLEEMRSDFEINPQQLELCSASITVANDPVNFRRVMENLVSNALKYGVDHSAVRIKVTAQQQGDMFQISVRDNGPGIDPQYHSRIFNVFQTLRVKDGKESTGIGLSIVKKAVEQHRGKITISSSLGNGATFTFDWPASFEQKDQVHAA